MEENLPNTDQNKESFSGDEEDFLQTIYDQDLPYWQNQSPPEKNCPFTDPLFPPNEDSLLGKNTNGEFIDQIDGPEKSLRINPSLIEWKRPKEIFENQKYLLFEGKIEMTDINQGALGDCYFLASTAAIAEYPNLIYQMFKTKEINNENYFEIVFYIDGIFQTVVVDDYLPVFKKDKKICFSRPFKNQLWVCILEKAWAKINGGYANIIKGYPHDALESFTGYPCVSYTHSSHNVDILWEAISNAKKNKFIVTGNTTSVEEVEKNGLNKNHAYTVIGTKVLNSKGKKIRLIELRNPHGFKTWKGDWSNKSKLWTEEELKQVNLRPDNDGVFYISAEDYFKFYGMTDICQMLYNGYSKHVKINKDEIKHGNVFQLYLKENSILSVSLVRKMWRFHRELRGTILPSFILITKYEPPNNNNPKEIIFTEHFSKYESFDNTFITKELSKGFYLIYCYQDLSHSIMKDKEDFYLVKFDANSKFKINKMPLDLKEDGLPLLKQIFIQEFIYEKEIKEGKKINKEESLTNLIGYKRVDLARKIVYNNLDKWKKITEDFSESENFNFFGFLGDENIIDNNKTFDWYIPPKCFGCFFGLVEDNKKQGHFKLNSKSFLFSNGPPRDKNIVTYYSEKSSFENFDISLYINKNSINDIDNNEEEYDYETISLEKAQEDLTFENINMSEMTQSAVEEKFPKVMKLLLKFPPVKNDSDLSWEILPLLKSKYIGQRNKNKQLEGRGAYIFTKSQSMILGYLKSGKLNGKVLEIGKNGGIIFNGIYKDGKKNGHGIFVDPKTGIKWEGNFVNGYKEGEFIKTEKNGEVKKVKVILKKTK